MSLLPMASSGLKSFTTNIKDSTIVAVSSAAPSVLDLGKQMVGSYLLNKLTGAGSLNNSFNESKAGNYRQGGNNRENSVFDYIANFKTGVMKSTRFRAEFNLPKGVSGSSVRVVNSSALSGPIKNAQKGMNATGQINVKCHTATFPSRQIDTLMFKSNSVNFRVPWNINYEPITLIFYADGNLDSREYFELWQSAVMNFGNNTSNFYNEYVSDVKLYLQNDYGADTYGIILYECYPVTISVLEVGAANTNTPLNIMVTLTFKSWIPMSNSNVHDYNRTV